jgi:hypothetical protein
MLNRIAYPTILFGLFAAAMSFHRFFDVAGRTDAKTLSMILLFCSLPLIGSVMLFQFFRRWKQVGIWLLMAFCLYIMTRHTFVYLRSGSRTNAFAVPEHIAQRITISFADVVYVAEITTGLILIFLLILYYRATRAAAGK